jgi:hypothetical protein
MMSPEHMSDLILFLKDNTFAKEFLTTALYQIVRRVRTDDPDIGDGVYPSFELEWRRDLAMRLETILPKPPDALCPTIHRVIPIGVSASDAMTAMTAAIPPDVQNPYAITMKSPAIDDRCGTIAITQPMQYTIVNVNCMVDPGILVDVCRELRNAHRDVMSTLHSIARENVDLREEMSDMNGTLSEMKDQLAVMASQMDGRVDTLDSGGVNTCSKKGCSRTITKRFKSGNTPKQCTTCRSYSH